MKLLYFVKEVASYVLDVTKKGIDELLVIKINDVEFRDSRDAPRKKSFPIQSHSSHFLSTFQIKHQCFAWNILI